MSDPKEPESAPDLPAEIVERPGFSSPEVARICADLPKPGMAVAVAVYARTSSIKQAAGAADVDEATVHRWFAAHDLKRVAYIEALAQQQEELDRLLKMAGDAVNVIERAIAGEKVPRQQLYTSQWLLEHCLRRLERIQSNAFAVPLPDRDARGTQYKIEDLAAKAARAQELRKMLGSGGSQTGGRR